MTLGIIGGTSADFPFVSAAEDVIATPFGECVVARGETASGVAIRFVRRHGTRHERLSSQVAHRANIWALKSAGCTAVVGTTVCGVVDSRIPLGGAILFDDLLFPDNRLPDGSPCTFFTEPGQADRGHYIFSSPFSLSMRAALERAAATTGTSVQPAGVYAYMLGPRFNSRAEIDALRAAGASAVSQTAGPEAVLAGELEIPYALVGFGVDYANGTLSEPTPVEVLDANIAASKHAFGVLIAEAAAELATATFDPGFVYRFE